MEHEKPTDSKIKSLNLLSFLPLMSYIPISLYWDKVWVMRVILLRLNELGIVEDRGLSYSPKLGQIV